LQRRDRLLRPDAVHVAEAIAPPLPQSAEVPGQSHHLAAKDAVAPRQRLEDAPRSGDAAALVAVDARDRDQRRAGELSDDTADLALGQVEDLGLDCVPWLKPVH